MRHASSAVAILVLACFVGVHLGDVRAQPAVSALASVEVASDAMRQLGLDDDRALAAMVATTFDGTRELPFDLAPYRTDANRRARLVRSILPVLRRIVESQVFLDAYARTTLAEVRRIGDLRVLFIEYDGPSVDTRARSANHFASGDPGSAGVPRG